MRILLVEDDRSCATLIRTICELEGHEVVSAYDGERGLALLREEQVDVMLLDIVMPGLDGLAVLRALRRHPRTRRLPVVVHTADVSEVNQRAIAALAPAAVIFKPFRRQELLDVLARLRLTGTKVPLQREEPPAEAGPWALGRPADRR